MITAVLPTRGALASSLADLVESSPELAAAITVLEAWRPGYASDLVAAAELIAGHLPFDADLADESAVAVVAVQRAVAEANPRAVLRHVDVTPVQDAIDAAMALTRAQASFHLVADGLERRRQPRLALAS